MATRKNCQASNNDELRSSKSDVTSYDANNNAGRKLPSLAKRTVETSLGEPTVARTAANLDESIKTTASLTTDSEQSQRASHTKQSTERRHARRSESNTSESDDWHLLDPDEHSTLASFSSKLANRGKVSSSVCCIDDTSTKEELAKKTMKPTSERSDRYLDVVPPGRDKLSPALIYICTLLYSLLPLASLLAFSTLLCLLFTKYWYITTLYYSYLIFDAKTCNQGGRRWDLVYRAKFWSYLAAYFPIKLRYSEKFKLDANENYILNYHPHGISAFGCVAAFATNGLNFSDLFPGVRSLFMVHETSFLVPIMRETFSLRGDCSVNSKSFDYLLGKRWLAADGAGGASNSTSGRGHEANACGNLLALCGGGLAEADLSDMEELKIVCATRKGFVKKALIHGAHLIPCIAFGENSVFTKVNFKPGSLLHKLEAAWYGLFKFKHPIYYGRSLLTGDKGKGLLPYKRPITVLMGDPIIVKRVENPSQEVIDELHSEYIRRLKTMYEDNRAQLCNKFDTKLKLV